MVDTIISGSVVATLIIVAPITNFGIFVTSAIQTAPSTNQSPPFTMSTMPMTNRKYVRNASGNMLSSLFKVMPP